MDDKILVLFVFHKFDKYVEKFFNKCIFKHDNISFLIIAKGYNLNL